MGVFRVVDKLLLIVLLIVIGPFLWVGLSAVLGKAPMIFVGAGLGFGLVAWVWYLLRKHGFLDEENTDEQR
jgi:hypothetical protein